MRESLSEEINGVRKKGRHGGRIMVALDVKMRGQEFKIRHIIKTVAMLAIKSFFFLYMYLARR